jgi:hypothetical protein
MDGNSVRAVINGDRIECKVCGALLAKLAGKHGITCLRGETREEYLSKNKPVYDADAIGEPCAIEIKCKHKSRGKYCDVINSINL